MMGGPPHQASITKPNPPPTMIRLTTSMRQAESLFQIGVVP